MAQRKTLLIVDDDADLRGAVAEQLQAEDFATVEALSSTVLAVLLALHKSLRAQGGRLAVCGLRPEVREVFVLTGLEGPLNVCGSEQQGLLSFQKR